MVHNGLPAARRARWGLESFFRGKTGVWRHKDKVLSCIQVIPSCIYACCLDSDRQRKHCAVGCEQLAQTLFRVLHVETKPV